jgi:PAS domain S-box-containing protein
MGSKNKASHEIAELQQELDVMKTAFNNYIAYHEQIEANLRESEEKYRMLIENLNEIIYTIDNIGNITYVSPNISSIAGYSPEMVLGKPFLDFVHREDRDRCLEQFKKVFSGIIETSEYRVITKEGIVWMRTTSRPLMKDGIIAGTQGVLTDISDLKESEQKLNTLVSQTPAIIYSYKIVDGEIHVKYVNENVTHVLGYAPEEFIGNTPFWMSRIHPDDKGVMKMGIKNNVKRRDSFYEYRFRDKSGTYRWMHDKQKVWKNGSGEIEVSGASWDITDRKNAENELIREKYFVEQRFMQSSVSTMILDSEGWCEKINPEFSRIFGVEPVDIEGKYNIFNDEITIREGVIPIIEKTFREGKNQEWEIYYDVGEASEKLNIRVRDKRKKWYYNWAFPILDENGLVVKVVIQHHDITDRKKRELDLILAKEKAEESNRLKSAFLANLSHEIRTPMNGILGFAELLNKPDLSKKSRKNYIDIITSSGKRLLETISQLMDISKIEAGVVNTSLSPVKLNDQLHYIYNFFKPEAENKNIGFYIGSRLTDEMTIKTDAEKFNAILVNLVNNAIKYTETGSVKFGYRLCEDEIMFYVSDSGIGVPSGKQKIIFERFRQADESQTRSYDGTGLGLSISKAYVEMLGGRIWLESEPGRGSVFYFTLPCFREIPESSGHARHDEVDNFDFSGVTVLIAEDEKFNQLHLKEIFRPTNARILMTENGSEAIDCLEANPGTNIALIDIKMPVMDGLETTRLIKRKFNGLPVIAQTAYAQQSNREAAILAGFDGFITKPINRIELFKLIRKFLPVRIPSPT